jgi:hypothetical protein
MRAPTRDCLYEAAYRVARGEPNPAVRSHEFALIAISQARAGQRNTAETSLRAATDGLGLLNGESRERALLDIAFAEAEAGQYEAALGDLASIKAPAQRAFGFAYVGGLQAKAGQIDPANRTFYNAMGAASALSGDGTAEMLEQIAGLSRTAA